MEGPFQVKFNKFIFFFIDICSGYANVLNSDDVSHHEYGPCRVQFNRNNGTETMLVV